MSYLGKLPSALWLISGIVAGCSLYPETPPIVDTGSTAGGAAGSGAGGSGAAGGSGGASGGTGGTAGGAEGGAGGSACTAPEELELQATADTFVASNQPTAMHGTDALLELDPSGARRVLVRFTLPTTFSSASVIVSATLELTVSETKSFAETLVAHRVSRVWDEDLVSWNTAEEGVTWSLAGGDFEVLGSAAATVAPTVAMGDSVSFDLTQDIRGFLTGTENQGWLVKVNDPTGQNSDRLRFASRESVRLADRPRLVISYCE